MSGTKCVTKGKIMHRASGDSGPSRDIKGDKYNLNFMMSNQANRFLMV